MYGSWMQPEPIVAYLDTDTWSLASAGLLTEDEIKSSRWYGLTEDSYIFYKSMPKANRQLSYEASRRK